MSESGIVLHGPFSGIAPKIDVAVSDPVERGVMLRDVLQRTLEIPYQLEVFQGELLYEVTRNKFWREWEFDSKDGSGFVRRYESFEEYVENELGFKRRKAYDLIDIYKTFIVDLKLDSDRLKDISWSKARLVTKVVDESNVEEMLTKIEPMSVRDVKEMVRGMKEEDPTLSSTLSEDALVRVVFQLAPAQAENLHHAIETAMKISGSEKPSHNIDLICTDFLSSTDAIGVEGALIKLDVAKQSLERAFGVKLEIKEMDEERFAKIESVGLET